MNNLKDKQDITSNEYSLDDFTETLNVLGNKLAIVKCIKAYGQSPEGGVSWEGGFVVKLKDGRYAHISGWCDYTGWGCQDGVNVDYANKLSDLQLPTNIYDRNPVDLNRYLEGKINEWGEPINETKDQ